MWGWGAGVAGCGALMAGCECMRAPHVKRAPWGLCTFGPFTIMVAQGDRVQAGNCS